MNKLLKPESIVVVGASKDTSKQSGKPLHYLQKHGYNGRLFAVNPKYKEIGNIPCYSALSEINEPIDLALLMVGPDHVLKALNDCANIHVKAVIICSSGFGETGKEGIKIQQKMAELGTDKKMLICGPNCMGIINSQDKVTASFTRALENNLSAGSIGFVTQSGAFGGSVLNMALEEGIGFSYWISTGNEAMLEAVDFLEYLVMDQNTKVIAGYIEGIKQGSRFYDLTLKALENNKPLVLLKAGTSEVGQAAIKSHTGSMAGNTEVFKQVCKQNGTILVHDIDELLDMCKGLSVLPDLKGNRLGIVTTSGGAGAILSDKCYDEGFHVPKLSDQTQEQLREILVSYSSFRNPVDITGHATGKILSPGKEGDMFKDTVESVLNDESIDGLIILISMVEGERANKVSQDLIDIKQRTKKPIIVIWLAGELARNAYQILEQGEVPVFPTLTRAVNVMKGLYSFSKAKERLMLNKEPKHQVNKIEIKEHMKTMLSEHEGKQLLNEWGIETPKNILTINENEAVAAAQIIGYPVVIKIVGDNIAHKTEVGGVKLNINSDEELRTSFRELNQIKEMNSDIEFKGILVEKMIQNGLELFLGSTTDDTFGPVITFGLGGVWIEVLKDYGLRIPPLNDLDIEDLLKEIKASDLLLNPRENITYDIDALKKTIRIFSEKVIEYSDTFREIDINPLFLLPDGKGVIAGDALILPHK
jgi:acyl-CoA synthetase (NDP forming)